MKAAASRIKSAAGQAVRGGALIGAAALAIPEAVCRTRHVRNGNATTGQAAAEVGRQSAVGGLAGAVMLGAAAGVGVLVPPAIPVIVIGAKAAAVAGRAAVACDVHQAATNPARCG